MEFLYQMMGKKIAYLGYDDKVQTYQVSKLYVMNIDGSNKTEIKTTLDRDISNLNWSEDKQLWGWALFHL